MEDRSSKVYTGLCVLVLVWIGVYWAWDPGKPEKPRISISQPEEIPVEDKVMTDPEVSAEDPATATQQETPDASANTEQTEPEPGPRLIQPEFMTHVIQEGEIMQDIAKRYYGEASRWAAISRSNPKVDPLKLRAGMTLRIPVDPNNTQGILDSDPDSDDQDSSAQETIVEYVVQSGDSLSLISQRFYGSSRHARFIYESNTDVLRSMDAIRVGQTLKLPPLNP